MKNPQPAPARAAAAGARPALLRLLAFVLALAAGACFDVPPFAGEDSASSSPDSTGTPGISPDLPLGTPDLPKSPADTPDDLPRPGLDQPGIHIVAPPYPTEIRPDVDQTEPPSEPCPADVIGLSASTPAPSCAHVKAADPDAGDGLYWLEPTGAGLPAFNAYCEMSTLGGGWTLVWKQSAFAGNHAAHRPEIAGKAPLLDERFDGSTFGSIAALFEHSEILAKSSDERWVQLVDRLDDWVPEEEGSPNLCRTVTNKPHTCHGVDCTSYRYMYLRHEEMGENPRRLSGFTLGEHGGTDPDPKVSLECGRVWCTRQKHGAFWGVCQTGEYGAGDWMIFVREPPAIIAAADRAARGDCGQE